LEYRRSHGSESSRHRRVTKLERLADRYQDVRRRAGVEGKNHGLKPGSNDWRGVPLASHLTRQRENPLGSPRNFTLAEVFGGKRKGLQSLVLAQRTAQYP